MVGSKKPSVILYTSAEILKLSIKISSTIIAVFPLLIFEISLSGI